MTISDSFSYLPANTRIPTLIYVDIFVPTPERIVSSDMIILKSSMATSEYTDGAVSITLSGLDLDIGFSLMYRIVGINCSEIRT